MKHFYVASISPNAYCLRFYELVLKKMNYEFVDSSDEESSILSQITSRDYVHLDIGPGNKKEWELVKMMVSARYQNIVVTIHQPFNYPYQLMPDKNLTAAVVTLVDKVVGRHKAARNYLEKIKTIYVLSPTAKERFESTFNLNNVRYIPKIVGPLDPHLPHVIRQIEI